MCASPRQDDCRGSAAAPGCKREGARIEALMSRVELGYIMDKVNCK